MTSILVDDVISNLTDEEKEEVKHYGLEALLKEKPVRQINENIFLSTDFRGVPEEILEVAKQPVMCTYYGGRYLIDINRVTKIS